MSTRVVHLAAAAAAAAGNGSLVRWIIIGVALLVLALGVYLLIRYLRKRAQEKAKVAPPVVEVPQTPEQRARQASLPRLFAVEMQRLRKHSSGRDPAYRIPWCLALSDGSAGLTTLVRQSGLHSPFTSEDETLSERAGCRFSFFDQGIVIDVNGSSFADASTFEVLLAELRKARARRPVDAVLLALPATDLYGEQRLGEDAAREKGEVLYTRIQQLQRRLGVRVPIYLVLSKCDAIPGFAAFSNALGSGHRMQLFGWSNPNPLTEPYRPELIDSAFDQIYQAQCQLQMDLLAADNLSEPERDAIFLLPGRILDLRAPLGRILDQMFRATVYSENTLLRGFYLCGDTTLTPAFGSGKPASALRQPAFVNHLFAQKIFPEFGLAQPLSGGAVSAANLLRAVKIATAVVAVIMIALLTGSSASLHRDTQAVIEFLEKIPRKNNLQDSGLPERERYARQSERLLKAMAQVPARNLRRALLPTSWVSSVDDDVRELLLRAFESVILSGLRSGMEEKAIVTFGLDAAALAARRDPNYEPPPAGEADPRFARTQARERPTTPPKVTPWQTLPEYLYLQNLSQNFGEFGRYVATYNQLGTERRKRMDTVPPLVKYVFGIELGEDFAKQQQFYEDALESASHRPYDLNPVHGKVTERARDTTHDLALRLFNENPVDIGLEQALRHLNRLRAENESGTPDLLELTRLRATLLQLEQDISRPEQTFLAGDKLELGAPYRELQTTLQLLGGDLMVQSVSDEWQGLFGGLRRRLTEYQAPGLGLLVGRHPDKRELVVQAPTVAVRVALDSFFGQSFVQQSGEAQPLTTPEGAYRVSWNEEALRQAVALTDAHTAFVRDRLPGIYPEIREVVRGTALEQVGKSVPILVAKARRIERITRPASDVQGLQDILSGEVSDLKRTGPVLRQILDTYERLGLKAQHGELYRQLEDDMREILRRIDLVLDRNDLYRVSSKLAAWRGLRSPALDAFDVEDAEGLNQYLKAQRTTVRNLARDYAKTPVSMLDGLAPPGGGAASDPLFTKWRNIVGEVERFEAMAPGNSIKELEGFVDTTLSSVTPENCQERLPRRTGDSRDYFLQSRARVYDAVRKRCSQFVEDRLFEGYDRLAARFNKTLAGRFPFSKNPMSLDEEEADPRDVRAFFAEYDQFTQKYDAFAGREEAALGSSSLRTAAGFIEAIRNVRPFFAPLLGERQSDAGALYGISVEYRVNRQAEINGNQIAEWSMAVADSRADDTQLSWRLGDKLRLSMRWAKDGPYQPSSLDQGKGTSVDGNDTIHFEWGGYWSILRFLRIYRSLPSDLRKAVDRQPHILKFVVEIAERKRSGRVRLLPDAAYNSKQSGSTPAAKSAFLFNRAVVFVRFAVTVGETKDRIVVPAEWPALAVTGKGDSGR